MRLLGIDFGSKKVGIALSNEGGTMAFPHDVVPNDEHLVEYITDLATAENVQKIVVGHSLDRDGVANPIHKQVTEFIGDLTLQVGVPIELEPEQYTTKEAERVQGKSAKTDASAAALILDSHITKHR